MHAFILAGGFATRLWPLTEKRAKPLLLLNGKTILAHILDQLPKDFSVTLLTNARFESDFILELKNIGRDDVKIICEDSISDGEKRGALRALSDAVKQVKITHSIAVCAGDNLLPQIDWDQLRCEKNEAVLAVRDLDNLYEAQKFGVVEVSNETVVGFEEKPEKPKSKTISTGFFTLGMDLVDLLHEKAAVSPDALGGIFPFLLEKNIPLRAKNVLGEWFDVGSFETYLEAHSALQKEDLLLARDAKQTGNVFSGKVFLGKGCEVTDCQLSDVILYPGTVLKNCRISQTIIDKNCFLEGVDLNRKLIREGTEIRA